MTTETEHQAIILHSLKDLSALTTVMNIRHRQQEDERQLNLSPENDKK